MSRTIRGTRPVGHDFWSRRPPSNNKGAGGCGPYAKKRTASIERQQAKRKAAIAAAELRLMECNMYE